MYCTPPKNNTLQRTTRVKWTKTGKQSTANSSPQRSRVQSLSYHYQKEFCKQNLTNIYGKDKICKIMADQLPQVRIPTTGNFLINATILRKYLGLVDWRGCSWLRFYRFFYFSYMGSGGRGEEQTSRTPFLKLHKSLKRS